MGKNRPVLRLNVLAYSYAFIYSLISGNDLVYISLMFIALLPFIIDKKCILIVLYESINKGKNLFPRVYSNLGLYACGLTFLLFFYSLLDLIKILWDISIKT